MKIIKYKQPYRESITIDGKRYLLSRFIYGRYLGRKMKPTEIVHHINGKVLDNRIENLRVVSRAEHKKLHDKIGMTTRFRTKYIFDEFEICALYSNIGSAIDIAKKYGCNEITIRRLIKKITNKKLSEIKQERGVSKNVKFKKL